MRGLRDGVVRLPQSSRRGSDGAVEYVAPCVPNLQRMARRRARVLAAGRVGTASGYLEVAARGLSLDLERHRVARYRLGGASTRDFPFSCPACECGAGTPPQEPCYA